MTKTSIIERFPTNDVVGWHGVYGRMSGEVKGWIGTTMLDVEYRGPNGRERFTISVTEVIGR